MIDQDPRAYQRFFVQVGESVRPIDVLATRDADRAREGGVNSGRAREGGENTYRVRDGDEEVCIEWTPLPEGRVLLQVAGRPIVARIARTAPDEFKIEALGRQLVIRAENEITARAARTARSRTTASGPMTIVAPMPGTVVQVMVSEGQVVEPGRALLIIEAMKMQNELSAPISGTIQGLMAHPGQPVEARQPLCQIVP